MGKARIMLSSDVLTSDALYRLSLEALRLYLRMQLELDFDGVLTVGREEIMRTAGAGPEAMEELEAAGLVLSFRGRTISAHHRVNNKRDAERSARSRHVAPEVVAALIGGGPGEWGEPYRLPDGP